ncbi:hypothetical protein BH20GEM2_BH20GEM2_21090 [soil metagenome]
MATARALSPVVLTLLCFALTACMPVRGNDPTPPDTVSDTLPETGPTSDADVIEGTGSVVRVELEGGFFAIEGDDGKTYDPTNLAEEFSQDGLRVRYELRPRHDMLGTHQVGTIVDVIRIERI